MCGIERWQPSSSECCGCLWIWNGVWCRWMQPMKKLVHRVLWCSQLLKKILGVPLESGLCMYVYSLKIKTVRGLLHAAVKTSWGGVFLLVHGPHGSAGCLSIRALGFQVSIQSGNMRCLFLSKWVQIFVSLHWWCDCFSENPHLVSSPPYSGTEQWTLKDSLGSNLRDWTRIPEILISYDIVFKSFGKWL